MGESAYAICLGSGCARTVSYRGVFVALAVS
jgi:hypothetical protein